MVCSGIALRLHLLQGAQRGRVREARATRLWPASCVILRYMSQTPPAWSGRSPPLQVGFDTREPTAHQLGKPQAIARLRELYPYDTVVMVGG